MRERSDREAIRVRAFSSWGWIHILLGIIAILAGVGPFSGAISARTVAVIVAVVSLIANFVWFPYYPCGQC